VLPTWFDYFDLNCSWELVTLQKIQLSCHTVLLRTVVLMWNLLFQIHFGIAHSVWKPLSFSFISLSEWSSGIKSLLVLKAFLYFINRLLFHSMIPSSDTPFRSRKKNWVVSRRFFHEVSQGSSKVGLHKLLQKLNKSWYKLGLSSLTEAKAIRHGKTFSNICRHFALQISCILYSSWRF